MNEWHDSSELRPATSRETAQMRTRLGQRRDALMQDDDMRFMKVSGASTKACDGQLIVLALCKALKIKAKLSILGTLPLMARLDLENPVDALSTMVHPWNLKSQMSYNLGKWLVLVPAKWLIGSQRRHNSFIVNDGFPTAIPSAGEIRKWNHDHEEEFEDEDEGSGAPNLDCFLKREPAGLVGAQLNPWKLEYRHTSFQTIQTLMVYAFFSCANRFVSLTSDEETHRLIQRAEEDSGFRMEFSITGPHVTPAPHCGHLTVSKAGAAVSADSSPEMALLGGFDGVF